MLTVSNLFTNKKIFKYKLHVFPILGIILFLFCSKNIIRNGWVDNDRYRVVGIGYAKKTETDPDKKIESACTAAKIMAEFKLLKKFSNTGSTSVNSRTKQDHHKKYSDIRGIIRKGRIIKQNYEPESSKCEVIYELYEPGLKKNLK